MEIDFPNTDFSATTGSTNPPSTGSIFAEQINPFTNSDARPMEWDFGNPSFGNGVQP